MTEGPNARSVIVSTPQVIIGWNYVTVATRPDTVTICEWAIFRSSSTRLHWRFSVAKRQPFKSVIAMAAIEPIKIVAPSEVEVRSMTIAAKIAGAESKSAAWVTLAISDNVQQVEPEQFNAEAAPLTLPFGLTGRLSSANERDKYLVQGTPGQATRFRARTRSLATPTLLQMELFNHATNAKVAETKVADTDEWSFDFTFPDNAVYRLETTDLLHRGGTAFGYYIEARPAGSFAIDLKPAAETKESYLLEPQHGAAALDLVIDRFGYDGEIALSLGGEAAGLRLSPDKIPTGAKEARVYLFADEAWQPNALRALRFIARSTTDPSIQSSLSSLAAHRIKQPHIPFPSDWNDGVIEAVGVAASEPFFALEPAPAATFAKPCSDHTLTLKLNRKQAEFKAAVTLQAETLPAGWTMTPTTEGDIYKVKCKADATSEKIEAVSLTAIGEFQNRMRRELVQVPIQWIDPLKVTAKATAPLIAGGALTMQLRVERAGDDAQPVVLKPINLPAGLTASVESITIAQTKPKPASPYRRQLSYNPPLG